MKALIEFIVNLLKAIFGGAQPAPAPAPMPTADQPPIVTPPPAPPRPSVDVERKLDAMAKESGQKLDWRRSVVDLLKVLDLNSSLLSRQTLARKLGYAGNMKDSEAMNAWLHGQMMARLTANGGEVPAELRP